MSDLHVLVGVADERYALRVDDVVEVAEYGTVAPLPGAPDAVLGNVHVLVTAQHDGDLARAVRDAWAVFPDGAPVAWLQRRPRSGLLPRSCACRSKIWRCRSLIMRKPSRSRRLRMCVRL